MYQNRLSLIGFSGKESEQKTTKNGTVYTVFSLATKTSWKNENDEWESGTEWHRIVVWSKRLAEFALELPKGAHLQVEGVAVLVSQETLSAPQTPGSVPRIFIHPGLRRVDFSATTARLYFSSCGSCLRFACEGFRLACKLLGWR